MKTFLLILFLIITMTVSVFAQDSAQSSKFLEIQNRLKNIKDNETVDDVLKEYAGGNQEKITTQLVPGNNSKVDAHELTPCSHEPFNISFLCDPRWEMQEVNNTVVFTISSSPVVTLSIIKVSEKVKYLEEINKNDLALTGQYADGFALQDVVLKHRKAKMVMGFSRVAPDIRLLDYYILQNGILYSVFFAVDPQKSWEDYKFLIKTIAESIDFKV